MKIFKWILYLSAHLAIIIFKYPIVPIAIALFSTEDKRHLKIFKWLETIDNDLSGDDGWKNEHIKPGSNPLSFWNRVKWLWRNGGNSFNYNQIGCKYESDVPPYNAEKGIFLIRKDGYWLLRHFFKICGKRLELFWGWGLYGNVKGRCKFTFTTRFTK